MQSVAAYFDVSDASQLNWAHRINTASKLEATLADDDIHVIEADIHFGAGDATPLVGESSDTAELDAATLIAAANRAGKAVKLDFQSPAAIEPTLTILRLLKPSTPVILHAEIFSLLSASNPAEAMEPDHFIRIIQHSCPTAVISLGWSLKRAHDADGRVEESLIQQIAIMLVQRLGPVNYGLEIRAGYTPGVGGLRAEQGAAVIFDPLPASPSPAHNIAHNVVQLVGRQRRVA
ncbi:MAG: DUF2181 domain-containing protein [Verrucomicrobiaceae bacterium]|nr:MAG: DUF2181 domain-containing protein [Verrucomicrobiaceae bacterium]